MVLTIPFISFPYTFGWLVTSLTGEFPLIFPYWRVSVRVLWYNRVYGNHMTKEKGNEEEVWAGYRLRGQDK